MTIEPAFGASITGVQAYVRHIKIDENEEVRPTDVNNWIAGYATHVMLRIGDIAPIIDTWESMVVTAARRIVEIHTAGDVANAAYQVGTGRTEVPPGKAFYDEANAELEALIARITVLVGTGDLPDGSGTGSHGFPLQALVRRTMRF